MSEPIFSVPRGMRDIEPDEMSKRLWMQEKILDVFRRYGFQLLEPTPIEALETLEAKSGPEIRDEIYWFKDKAGRSLGLRFDLTVGMTRMVANRFDLPEPIKLCAISASWRYDEPQFARYRCFYQWDAEIYGSSKPEADAEAISVGADILESVGLKEYEVRISNRKLTEDFLREIGLNSPSAIEQAFRAIDKFRKISEAEVRRELEGVGIPRRDVEEILNFISIRGSPNEVLGKIPSKMLKRENASKAWNELSGLADALKAFNKIDKCIFDMSVVRGIGYYDGIVFEAYDKGGEDIGSIFGGGRYDKLCGIYGKRNMPATGVAGGIERLMISLERASLFPSFSKVPAVFIVAVNDEVREKSWELAQQLRRAGISVDFDLKRRSLKKQLEYVDSLRIPYAIIVGPKELGRGAVKLRDMIKREEVEVKLEEIARKVPSF
jgi:histidyl-tRNA synthetase